MGRKVRKEKEKGGEKVGRERQKGQVVRRPGRQDRSRRNRGKGEGGVDVAVAKLTKTVGIGEEAWDDIVERHPIGVEQQSRESHRRSTRGP